jgi:hypothetical protein
MNNIITYDVIGERRPFLARTNTGNTILVLSRSVIRAATFVQDFIGDMAEVVEVFDEQKGILYSIEWGSYPE